MSKLKAFLRRPQVWGVALSIAIMALLSLAFFYPDNFDGRSLRQADMQQGAANGHEAQLFEQQTGEKTLWTNALFGGMPTFQISPSYPSNSLFTWLNSVYGLGLPAPSNLLFMMMFGFFILLISMRMRWYYALIGAIAWGLSSYFVIIIGAGHIWKFITLAYVPPTIAGLLLLYRRRYITGAAMLALFAMLQLNANHPQMSYYFGMVMALIAIAWLIEAIRRHTLRRWLAATGIALAAGLLAVGANAPSLYNTYLYSKETKRTQSELSALPSETDVQSSERPTGGMPYSQIVGWSYGRTEMLSLIVPNIKGGATARPEGGKMVAMSLSRLDDAADYAATAPLLEYLSQYFNDSEGTNGPVYVGALIFALFLVGCFIVRGPLKWAMLAATLLSVLLALGRNAAGITDFMIDCFPLYNKFRAVESILVIAEFTIPFLAVLALVKLIDAGHNMLVRYRRPLTIGFGVPTLISLAALAVPSMFGDAITNTDRTYAENIQDQYYEYMRDRGVDEQQCQQMLYQLSLANPANSEAIRSLRYGMVRADGLRSLVILLLGFGFLTLFAAGKTSRSIVIAAIGIIIAGDLYLADKRYVSHSSFTEADTPDGHIAFTPDAIDRAILADTTSHYRVLDIPGFYTADRSYFHKTLGGYHAAKLNRYEDLIARKLSPVVSMGYFPDDPVLDLPQYAEPARRLRTGYRVADMLNARYVITGDKDAPVVRNSNALGNAWLVDSVIWVDGADAEMAALDASSLDFSRQAVADRRFSDRLPQAPSLVPGDTVYLTSYAPNRLTYHASTARGGIAVFSEVYFPWGWKAEIDGKAADLARVNYLLRALALPAGSHTVSMTFEPDSIRTSSNVAYACVTLIYMLLAAALFVRLGNVGFTKNKPEL